MVKEETMPLPLICPKLNDCQKVAMVLDKDLLDLQYAEAIKSICARCTEKVGKQVRRMILCERCGHPMVLAAMYDPDGGIPLHGGITDPQGVPILVCINSACDLGRLNVMEVSNATG